MSLAGITNIHPAQLANVQRNFQKVQSEFKQLGQDLQAGNLTQAQADFVVLSQSLASPPNFVGPTAIGQPNPTATSTASSQANSSNMVGPTALSQAVTSSHHRVHFRQALSQLGQALQAGDLGVARQAFATMQQIWQMFASNTSGSPQATPVNVSA